MAELIATSLRLVELSRMPSTNISRFSKLFHSENQEKTCKIPPHLKFDYKAVLHGIGNRSTMM